MPNKITDFVQTISSYFKIGNVRVKDNNGVLEAKNSDDSEYVVVRADSPVGDNDVVIKSYADSIGGGSARVVRFPIGTLASQADDFSIPANARILEIRLVITTAYNNNAGIQVGRAGSLSLLLNSTLNEEEKMLVIEDDVDWGGESTPIVVTVTGSPTLGAGVVMVLFSNPN